MKSTNSLRFFLAAAITVGAMSSSVSASAQANGSSAPADAAKSHLDRGGMFYDLQDWASAAREFKEAYMVDPKPQTLFMLAQAQRLGGDFVTAIGSYKAYSRLPGVTPTQQAAAEALVHKCEAEIEAKKNAGATAPPPTTTTTTTATATGSAAPPKDKPSPPGPWYGDALGGILFFGGLAVAGGGTALLIVGNAAMSRSASAPSYGTYQDQNASAKPEQTIGVIGIGVGAALVVGGVLRYVLVAGRKHDTGSALMLAPGFGPGLVTANVVGRF